MVILGLQDPRVVGGSPDHIVVDITQVEELAPAVPRHVLPVAGDRHVLPAAVSAAAVGHHYGVAPVGQEVSGRHRRIREGVRSNDGRRQLANGADVLDLLHMGLCELGAAGNALLEQQFGRADHRVAVEAVVHAVPGQFVADGYQAHPLVVGEVRAHHGAPSASRHSSWRVVERLVIAVTAASALFGEYAQVLVRLTRTHRKRKHRRVGRDDDIVRQAALESQARHAESLVLIDECSVLRVESGLRDPPGHAALLAVLYLPLHDGTNCLVEHGQRPGAHDEHRHEVLEHRSAPRQ